MRAINLLPEDAKRSRRGPRVNLPLVGGAALLALVIGLLVIMSNSAAHKVTERQNTLDSLRERIAGVPPAPVAPAPTTGQTGLEAEKAARVTAITSALSRRIAWERVLRQFALVLPSDVWLTSMSLHAPIPATSTPGEAPTPAPAPTTGVTIVGYTYSQAGVARMLGRVSAVPYFTNVTLQSSAQALVGKRNVVSFTILAGMQSPTGVSS